MKNAIDWLQSDSSASLPDRGEEKSGAETPLMETAGPKSSRLDPVPSPLRSWVSELSQRKSWIYWTDFLASLSVGYLAFALFPLAAPFTLRGALAFTIATFATYRAVVFIHEIVHMKPNEFLAFRFTWNFLCGIPLLVPLFLYETHLQHHSHKTYGSKEDGEYVSFARLPRRTAIVYVLVSFLGAPILVGRFLVLAPLRWIFPSLSRFVLTRVSALAIDGEYERPLKPGPVPWSWIAQEAACFAWCVTMAALALTRHIRAGRLLEFAAIMTAVVLINSLRTLGSHRFRGNGEPMSFAEQIFDSNDFPSPLAELLAPVGLRFHAMHHLFPQLPYHALPEARRRMLSWAESKNPIRESDRGSLLKVLLHLMRRERRSA